MVEQLPLKQRVGGSSPPRLTTYFQWVSLFEFIRDEKPCAILCRTWLKIGRAEIVYYTPFGVHPDVRKP
jgi:hypothetical protein